MRSLEDGQIVLVALCNVGHVGFVVSLKPSWQEREHDDKFTVECVEPVGVDDEQSIGPTGTKFAPHGAPARGSTALGAVPGTQRLSLSVVLPPSNTAGLHTLLANLYKPSSP